MIDNSMFVRPLQAKHICMNSVQELYKNVSPDVMVRVLALSHVVDCITMFVFSQPTTHEKAIRSIVINRGYIEPIHLFRSMIRNLMEFSRWDWRAPDRRFRWSKYICRSCGEYQVEHIHASRNARCYCK